MELRTVKNIAERVFQVKPIVVYSDAPRVFESVEHDGSMGKSFHNVEVYAFTPEKVFVKVDVVNHYISSNYAYTEPRMIPCKGVIPMDVPILVINSGYDRWEGQEPREWHYATLYPEAELPF